MFTHTRTFALAIAAASALSLATAHAQTAAAPMSDDSTTLTRRVETADLDLHTQAGVSELRHRIRVASRKVCGPDDIFGTPGFQAYQTCRELAERTAMAQSNAIIASVRGTTTYADATPR